MVALIQLNTGHGSLHPSITPSFIDGFVLHLCVEGVMVQYEPKYTKGL